MNGEILLLIADYGGLVIGAFVLLLATYFLPQNIRWHVLTAGVALLVFRGYQIYSSRQKLKLADAEREKLRAERNQLEDWLGTLQKQSQELQQQKLEIEEKGNQLKQESQSLDISSEEALKRKAELDQQAEQLLQQSQQLKQDRDEQLSAIELALKLNKQLSLP